MSDKKENRKPVWVVLANTDLTEGKGCLRPLWVCESETTARRMAKGRCVQGSDGRVMQFEAERIDGYWHAPVYIQSPTTDDLKNDERIAKARRADQLKHEALGRARAAGLSEEDIAILGGANGH